jgi:hypothetical protein
MDDPPQKDRRSSPRRAPSYTPTQINNLRIATVHFRDHFMFCLLSDGNRVCVPLAISQALQAAPQHMRYQWQVADDGRSIVWYTRSMGVPTAHITLRDILAHPGAQITRA